MEGDDGQGENDRSEAAVAAEVRDELGRVLTDQATAEAQRAAASALTGAAGDILGAATAGVSRLVLAGARAALGPTADEKVEAAARIVDRDAVIALPRIEAEVTALGVDAARARLVVAALVAERADGTGAAFVEELARALLEGAVPIDAAARSRHFGEAVMSNLRRAFEVADPCVLPTLARLTVVYTERPLDRFFRGAGRVLVDLSRAEFDRLVLLGQALGALADRTSEREFTLTCDLEADGLEWLTARDASFAHERRACVRDAETDAVLRALRDHGLADAPVPTPPDAVTQMVGDVSDRLAMSMDRRRAVFTRDVCLRLAGVLVAVTEEAA